MCNGNVTLLGMYYYNIYPCSMVVSIGLYPDRQTEAGPRLLVIGWHGCDT